MTAKIIDLLLRRSRRITDHEPLAYKVQREHEADMWAIMKQAEKGFNDDRRTGEIT